MINGDRNYESASIGCFTRWTMVNASILLYQALILKPKSLESSCYFPAIRQLDDDLHGQ